MIDIYRDMDLSKPGGKQFLVLLEKFSAATRSAAILKGVQEPSLLAMSSKTPKSSKNIKANSGETSKTQTLCVKCQDRFDVTKNIKTGLMFNVCKKCWLLALKEKKKSAPTVSATPIPKKVSAVLPATAKNFAGGNRGILPASSATQFEAIDSEDFITNYESDTDGDEL